MKERARGIIRTTPRVMFKFMRRKDENPIEAILSGALTYLSRSKSSYPLECLRRSNASIKGSLWFSMKRPRKEICNGAIISVLASWDENKPTTKTRKVVPMTTLMMICKV